MKWYTVVLGIVGGVVTLAVTVLSAIQGLKDKIGDWIEGVEKALNWIIEFYLSLIAYFVLHLLIVTSSDFVDAFNIPPLNIGIYIDKLAAIRALLMVIADIFEYAVLDLALKGSNQGVMQLPLVGGGDAFDPFGKTQREKIHTHGPKNPRRLGSLLSFLGMLVCRILYLWIVYKSDNKSLSVFIVLCIEGFWFGVFQMSFFAIGPQYNAVTSLGIHTMGNFIFFGQLIMQRQSKSRPVINCLYRVRVNAWICLITSISALFAWLGFCLGASGQGDSAALGKYFKKDGTTNLSPTDFENKVKDRAVWSPFLLFIVGAFAEDFSVPGILPFAFLDNDLAALVNYLTPLFFMTGAMMTVLLNDVFTGTDLGFPGVGKTSTSWCFKKWSVYGAGLESTASVDQGRWWNFLWLLNVPKYVAFFIGMWCIHGTYGSLRCIVQSRWRVMLLTMFVVIPRAWLETAGYVGVANYANGATANIDGGTGNAWGGYDEFKYIAYHDMVAMFCRFVYGKFAVGYNWTMVSHLMYYYLYLLYIILILYYLLFLLFLIYLLLLFLLSLSFFSIIFIIIFLFFFCLLLLLSFIFYFIFLFIL